MRLCPSCGLRKLNANFNPSDQKRRKGRCDSCCSPGARGKTKHMRTTQAEPIKPSKDDAKLIASAKAERKKFEKRGSPAVLRSYAYVKGNIPSRIL